MSDAVVPGTSGTGTPPGTPPAGVGQGTPAVEPAAAGSKLLAGQYATVEDLERGALEKQRLIERQAGELGTLRALVQQGQAKAEPPKPLVQVGDKLFENIDGSLTEVVNVAVQQAREEIRRENQQAAAVEKFFADHKEIDTEAGRELAGVVAVRVAAEMPYATPQEKAEEVVARVTKMLSKERAGRTAPTPPHVGAPSASKQEPAAGTTPAPMTPEQSRARFMEWRKGLSAPRPIGGFKPRGS